MRNPLSLLANLFPKPKSVPPSSLAEPFSLSPEDRKVLTRIGILQNELRDSVTQSTQVNFERVNIYREVDRASQHWMVGSALELYADYATNYNQLQNSSVWVTSEAPKYEAMLTKFLEEIGVEEKIFDWGWTCAAYGDLFVGVEGEPGAGIVAIDDGQHPASVSRVDYRGTLVGFYKTPFEMGSLEMAMPSGGAILIPPWEWVHFRVLGAKKKRPVYGDPTFSEYRTIHLMGPETKQVTSKYGTSLVINGIPVYKRLRLTEDSLLLARLTRGILKYIYLIKVDGSNVEAAGQIVEEYMTILKRARALNTDPSSPNYDSKCLRGDTKIRFCNGQSVPIKGIVENKEQFAGKHVWSVNSQTLHIEPVRIISAQKTRENTQLVRVYLDNGEHIDCTPDHPFMTRDGSFKQAQNLKQDESLMPFYSKLALKDMFGYELVYDPGKEKRGGYIYAHRVSFKPKQRKGYVIHHRDFDPLNNDPDNLVLMITSEHRVLHVKNCDQNRIVKCFRTKFCACGCESQLKRDSRYEQFYIRGHNNTGKKFSRSAEFKIRHSISRKAFWRSAKGIEAKKKIVSTFKKRVAAGQIVLQRIERETRTCRCGCGATFVCKVTEVRSFLNKYHYWNFMRQQGKQTLKKVANHKVVKVEWLAEREDTYDITVEKNHNFSLSSGIFVHNSNPLSTVEDLFVPVFGDIDSIRIEKIGGEVDIRWIKDVEELRNQLASALRCPLALLGGYVQEASGQLGAEAISQLDIRFARAARRLQRALIGGITRLCQIHLAYQNMDPDPRLFEIHMSETSTAEEEQLRTSMDTSVDTITKFMEMLDGVAPNFDKVEVLDYFNRKLLKLGDLDLKSYLKVINVPEGEEGMPEEGAMPPVEGRVSKAQLLSEARKLLEKEKKKVRNGSKIMRNRDFVAALPLPENSTAKRFDPGKRWLDEHKDVKITVKVTKQEKPKAKKGK